MGAKRPLSEVVVQVLERAELPGLQLGRRTVASVGPGVGGPARRAGGRAAGGARLQPGHRAAGGELRVFDPVRAAVWRGGVLCGWPAWACWRR